VATQQGERMLTRPEAAEYLGIKPQTLAVWAMSGKHLPVVKVGKKSVRYRESDLRAFIERQLVPATA